METKSPLVAPNAFRSRVWACYIAVGLAMVIAVGCNLIPSWGSWYSSHLPLRWQTERMADGHLSLSDNAAGMGWDLAWSKDGVQQVWGLGVASWRFIFEFAAKAIGQPTFPDRVAFIIALGMVLYIVVRFHIRFASHIASGKGSLWALSGLFSTILFPPFLTVCSSRFLVYEEMAAYGFLSGLLLLVWTLWLWFRPHPVRFLGLAAAASLISFIRPTLAVYGVTSMIIAVFVMARQERSRLWLSSGAGVFATGLGFALWCNWRRFGSVLEFGYSLNVNSLSAMNFAARFGNPYQHEPLVSAGKELFGLLFLTRSVIGWDSYGSNLFAGQSSTFRWRELYFSTFDLYSFIAIAVAWTYLVWRIWLRMKRKQSASSVFEIASLWSLISAMPLAVFYLRFPFASSRYLLDFAPSFAAATWVLFGIIGGLIGGSIPRRKWMEFAGVALLAGWWSYEILTLKLDRAPKVFTQSQVLAQMAKETPRRGATIPECYATNGFSIDATAIPFNGTGWDTNTGITKACVVLFVSDPTCLTLELAPSPGMNVCAADYDCIRAKIGLEFLRRKSIAQIAGKTRIDFYGPQNARTQQGIQELSLATMKPQQLRMGDSRFRLLKISWHPNPPVEQSP